MNDSKSFASLLEEYLDRNGRSPLWLAAELDINPEIVVGWLSGNMYPGNEGIVNQILEALDITDKLEQDNLRQARIALAASDIPSVYQTNIFGPVHGPVHTGTGDININPLSLTALKEWLDGIFHWPEAPEHIRSSWAGLVIWSMTAVTNQLTPQRWITFMAAVLLWAGTTWLGTPLLQWPLADTQSRLWAVLQYAAVSLIIPLIVASISTADNQPLFTLKTSKDRRLLWFLKVTGALVGFNLFYTLLLGLSLGLYYLTLSTLPTAAWWVLLLIPLLFAYIVARRIPADRYKMFDGELKAHDADRLFFAVFLLFGPFLSGFIYFFYWFLAERVTGFAFLLIIMGIALWEQKKQTPEAVSDRQTILAIGLFLPLAAFFLYLFFSQQFSDGRLPGLDQQFFTLLAFAYILGPIIVWVTLAVRNKPIVTLKGVVGLLGVTAVLNLILLCNLAIGRWVTLVVFILWNTVGRKQTRPYLRVHLSFSLTLISVAISFYLAVKTAVPIWANFIGFIILTTLLTHWAYQKAKPPA